MNTQAWFAALWGFGPFAFIGGLIGAVLGAATHVADPWAAGVVGIALGLAVQGFRSIQADEEEKRQAQLELHRLTSEAVNPPEVPLR